jgi:hypothetical protein
MSTAGDMIVTGTITSDDDIETAGDFIGDLLEATAGQNLTIKPNTTGTRIYIQDPAGNDVMEVENNRVIFYQPPLFTDGIQVGTASIVSGAIAIGDDRHIVRVNASGGPATLTFTATQGAWWRVTVNDDPGLNAITLQGASGLINGQSTYTGLTTQYQTVDVYCDGTNFWIPSEYHPEMVITSAPSTFTATQSFSNIQAAAGGMSIRDTLGTTQVYIGSTPSFPNGFTANDDFTSTSGDIILDAGGFIGWSLEAQAGEDLYLAAGSGGGTRIDLVVAGSGEIVQIYGDQVIFYKYPWFVEGIRTGGGTSTFTPDLGEFVIEVDASAAPRTLTFSNEQGAWWRVYVKTDPGGNAITLQGSSGLINGQATYTGLTKQYQCIDVWCDGTNYWTMSNFDPDAVIASVPSTFSVTQTFAATTLFEENIKVYNSGKEVWVDHGPESNTLQTFGDNSTGWNFTYWNESGREYSIYIQDIVRFSADEDNNVQIGQAGATAAVRTSVTVGGSNNTGLGSNVSVYGGASGESGRYQFFNSQDESHVLFADDDNIARIKLNGYPSTQTDGNIINFTDLAQTITAAKTFTQDVTLQSDLVMPDLGSIYSFGGSDYYLEGPVSIRTAGLTTAIRVDADVHMSLVKFIDAKAGTGLSIRDSTLTTQIYIGSTKPDFPNAFSLSPGITCVESSGGTDVFSALMSPGSDGRLDLGQRFRAERSYQRTDYRVQRRQLRWSLHREQHQRDRPLRQAQSSLRSSP